MNPQGTSVPPGMTALLNVEARLAAALTRAAEEVAHAECLDCEQRAEIYAILDSLRMDTQAHSDLVGRWVNDRTGKASDV